MRCGRRIGKDIYVVTLEVSTGKAKTSGDFLEVLTRGRTDLEYWWQTFLDRTPTPGQLKFHAEATATENVLASSNRWGKTTLLPAIHYHAHVYKTDAEPFYTDEDNKVDPALFLKCRYRTAHVSYTWDLAKLCWDEALMLHKSSRYLQAFVKAAPLSHPVDIQFASDGVWKFRTLGHDASGIDGDSYYKITIDEAGWIPNLEEMRRNVILVRIADVRGQIFYAGTFKPGCSRDFFQLGQRAASSTGIGISFEHRDDLEEEIVVGGLHPTIQRYLREFGVDLSEYVDAVTAGA